LTKGSYDIHSSLEP